MKTVAREYYEQGCNIVVLNAAKEPLVKWSQWETQRQTLEEFEALPWDRAELYAIVCGLKLNNGLYAGAIDIDTKKVTDEAIEKGKQLEKLVNKTVTQTEKTANNGLHLIFYSQKPIKTDNKAHDFCGCEVLGERKLCIMAPSKGYKKLNDNVPRTVESLNQLVDNNLKRIGYKTEGKYRHVDTSTVLVKHKIRPCIHEALKKEHLTQMQKVAVVTEFFHSGATQAEIEVLFAQHNSWEGTAYDPEKTRYMINHIISKPYQRFSCHLLDEEKLCLGPENCAYRESKNGVFFNKEGTFQPVVFAKHLLENWHFKTMRDNEELYVFNWEKGIYEPIGEVFVKEQTAKQLDEETRHRYLADVLFYIKGVTYFDRIHNPLGVVALENGYLDVRTKELENYSPQQFITTQLPLKYDARAQCPKIKQFIIEVVGKEQEPLIQEALGYCLYKATPIHKALMLIGDGANGKSTLLELFKKFLGSENVSNASLQSLCFSRFAGAELYNKLANICADLPDTALRRTGMFKMLTGNDTIMGEEKWKKPFSFKNHAKLIFSTNKVPETLDDTVAFFRRWILITCSNVFIGEKCKPNILEEISSPEEMSGLLNYALEGLDRILKNGCFSSTENIEEMRAQYIRSSNSAKAFIEEKLEFDPDPKAIITVVDLYEKYILFCQTNNLPSMQKREFTINIQQHLPQARRTTERIKKKVTKVWQYVKISENNFVTDSSKQKQTKIVTDVTTSPFKHKLPSPLDPISVTTQKESEFQLNKKSVTKVTNPEATTCPICLGLLPEDGSYTTTWEGKTVHMNCYLAVTKGRREYED